MNDFFAAVLSIRTSEPTINRDQDDTTKMPRSLQLTPKKSVFTTSEFLQFSLLSLATSACNKYDVTSGTMQSPQAFQLTQNKSVFATSECLQFSLTKPSYKIL